MADTATVTNGDSSKVDDWLPRKLAHPRVERAIDRLHDRLAELKQRPEDSARQESFCFASRTAESFLYVTWEDRGGYYRPESLARMTELLRTGLRLLNDHRSSDGKTDYFIPSIERRLQWVEDVACKQAETQGSDS